MNPFRRQEETVNDIQPSGATPGPGRAPRPMLEALTTFLAPCRATAAAD